MVRRDCKRRVIISVIYSTGNATYGTGQNVFLCYLLVERS